MVAIHLPIHLSICHPSICLFLHLSIDPPIHPLIHLPIYQSIHP